MRINKQELDPVQQNAASYRASNSQFAQWARGCGVIKHSDETQLRVFDLCQKLLSQGRYTQIETILKIFTAADYLTNAAMWLVIHMTYTHRVKLDASDAEADDFKKNPQGHTGGSLNMVPAYIGYLTANTLAGKTRSWLMGQGHCVAAIDSVNVLVGNMLPEQACRYALSTQGLSQLAMDFYSYASDDKGRPSVPLGSHVNPYTAGGIIEGGYLGFAELQYVHMPLPGEQLVAFLSDGAFEEQRGSDWASRWWRAEDSGLVIPVMIANGRRIDQRSIMYQQGGLDWFIRHLQLNGFDPIGIDGRDPADFIWGIFEAESRLQACAGEIAEGRMSYPLQLPYLIAQTVKGYGFYGSGTNAAHGLPLPKNPKYDQQSRIYFNDCAKKMFVAEQQIKDAVLKLNSHASDDRLREKDNPLCKRNVSLRQIPLPQWLTIGDKFSPMEAIDYQFVALINSNPHLRIRVGNPDEMRSNRMGNTLDRLKHRVAEPEDGVAESIHGSVITVLNEEAVVSAALANKGGISLVVSYEAFAVKMLGALRQEIIFARHQKEIGRAPTWLSVPVIATSHLWENGKNEQSHQDSLFGEALMAEMADVARVVYPGDANTAMACLNACYQTQGQIWAMTIPKQPIATVFDDQQAKQLVLLGALTLGDVHRVNVQLVAIGAYQLETSLAIQSQLIEEGIVCCVTYLLEPSRFRIPRDNIEREHLSADTDCSSLFPDDIKLRVFITHFRPEVMLGVCRPLDLGVDRCLAFGYTNHGGTLDTSGLLKANGCDVLTITNRIKKRLSRLE